MRRFSYLVVFLGLFALGVSASCRRPPDGPAASADGPGLASPPAPADNKPPRPDPRRADSILSHAPLTIVFRKVREHTRNGLPHEWTYSINSAGVGELTIRYVLDLSAGPQKPTRQKFEVPAAKMDAIRTALRAERFFNLTGVNGPLTFHSGWTTLAVVAGPLAATWEFPSTDWGHWSAEQHKAAAPAMRVFVAMCEAVDPDAQVFTELPGVKRIVADLKE